MPMLYYREKYTGGIEDGGTDLSEMWLRKLFTEET